MVLLYIANTSYYFNFCFLEIDHSKITVGQEWDFWMTEVVKQHFVEQCIQHNDTLFIWAIFQNWKKWMMIVGKECIQGDG